MSGPTIKMPAELLAKWLAALRSGEYKQAKNELHRAGGYCCLGVLQVVKDGKTEHGTYPSSDWCQLNAVQFLDEGGYARRRQPYLPTLDMLAGDANDSGKTFAEIADAIEACAVGV